MKFLSMYKSVERNTPPSQEEMNRMRPTLCEDALRLGYTPGELEGGGHPVGAQRARRFSIQAGALRGGTGGVRTRGDAHAKRPRTRAASGPRARVRRSVGRAGVAERILRGWHASDESRELTVRE